MINPFNEKITNFNPEIVYYTNDKVYFNFQVYRSTVDDNELLPDVGNINLNLINSDLFGKTIGNTWIRL